MNLTITKTTIALFLAVATANFASAQDSGLRGGDIVVSANEASSGSDGERSRSRRQLWVWKVAEVKKVAVSKVADAAVKKVEKIAESKIAGSDSVLAQARCAGAIEARHRVAYAAIYDRRDHSHRSAPVGQVVYDHAANRVWVAAQDAAAEAVHRHCQNEKAQDAHAAAVEVACQACQKGYA